MALKDLLSALEADADAESERLRAKTDAEASRVVESARLEARTLEEQAARADDAEFARALERRRAEARLAAAAIRRDAYESCVETLRGALRDRLGVLRETDEYRAVFRGLLEESITAVPTASLLRVDPRDEQLARAILHELDLRVELRGELETLGGVEVDAGDGLTVRNTLEDRLRNADAALRMLAGEFLDAAARSAAGGPLP